MKTSDSVLKVNRNIYPDAVTCDRMRLIGPKCDQLGPITIVYLKSPNEKTNSFCFRRENKHINEKTILLARIWIYISVKL